MWYNLICIDKELFFKFFLNLKFDSKLISRNIEICCYYMDYKYDLFDL